ncbi:MAG: hypothetical protein WD688_18440 [Candidatus Binatia bacterium]
MKNSSFDLGNTALVSADDLVLEPVNQDVRNGGRERLGSALPKGRLMEILGLDDISAVEDLLRTALLNPVAELTSNRGKRIRGQLVTLAIV